MRELDETITADAELGDATEVFDETEEMELAAQLLEITNERELDQFLGRLISRATGSLGQFARSGTGRAIGGILKQAARKTLPLLGRAIGGYAAGPAGARTGAQLATVAGRLFGLELEGLSPEDQEFETARRFVRFSGSAVRHAARASRRRRPRAAAHAGAMRAARRFAPGLVRPVAAAAATAGPEAPGTTPPRFHSGGFFADGAASSSGSRPRSLGTARPAHDRHQLRAAVATGRLRCGLDQRFHAHRCGSVGGRSTEF